ncbi:hypothetical protein L195_g042591, partial [Trifolium pratense]
MEKQQKLLFWCSGRNSGALCEIVQQKKRLVSVSVPQAEKSVPQAEICAPGGKTCSNIYVSRFCS